MILNDLKRQNKALFLIGPFRSECHWTSLVITRNRHNKWMPFALLHIRISTSVSVGSWSAWGQGPGWGLSRAPSSFRGGYLMSHRTNRLRACFHHDAFQSIRSTSVYRHDAIISRTSNRSHRGKPAYLFEGLGRISSDQNFTSTHEEIMILRKLDSKSLTYFTYWITIK